MKQLFLVLLRRHAWRLIAKKLLVFSAKKTPIDYFFQIFFLNSDFKSAKFQITGNIKAFSHAFKVLLRYLLCLFRPYILIYIVPDGQVLT